MKLSKCFTHCHLLGLLRLTVNCGRWIWVGLYRFWLKVSFVISLSKVDCLFVDWSCVFIFVEIGLAVYKRSIEAL